ncbi:hypothetical protein MPER_13039 [Moniliophthora perniciosa FA553]|nr:hypothetical protein MPER_13039 [Moniliophthora perniciosa FA553]
MFEKVTGGLNMALCRYSDTWRVLRKAAQTILTPKAVEKHLPIQLAEATQVLHDFLTHPDDFFKHIGRYTFFETMELWNLCTSLTAVPPVDLLPFLDYIPERWAWWKRLAAETRQKQRALYFGLVDECEQRMKRGEENGSYIEEILTKQKELGLDREMVGYLGGTLLEAGSDTTTSFLRYLVMALVSFPDVQRKAQAEIDHMVGQERMPSLADIKDLPYIQALIKELHRFMPHATITDEEYRGFVIQKSTSIFVNTYRDLTFKCNPTFFKISAKDNLSSQNS